MKLRIYNDDTLEQLGVVDYQEARKREISILRELWFHRALSSVLFIAAMSFFITSVHNANNYAEMRDECTDLSETMITMERNSSLIKLAGEYLLCGQTPLESDSVVYAFIKDECKAAFPDIVFAQFVIESGKGVSSLAQRTNNCFGMKKVSRGKPTTQIGVTESGFGIYRNWQSSVIDRVLWDVRVCGGKPLTRDEYVSKISRIYASDPSYISKLEGIISDYGLTVSE